MGVQWPLVRGRFGLRVRENDRVEFLGGVHKNENKAHDVSGAVFGRASLSLLPQHFLVIYRT